MGTRSRAGRSYFFFSSGRRHTRYWRDWSSDVCSSDLAARRRTPTTRLPGGGAEYAADALEEAAFEATREAIERSGPPLGIGVASMAESGFLLGEGGEALAPAMAWFDGRTAPQAERWRERIDAEDLFSRTGLHATPLPTACKLEWLREDSPDIFARRSEEHT